MYHEFPQNSIIVCTNYDKEKILENNFINKKINDYKIIDISEFINNMTFNYDTKTIYYVMHKFNIKYEVALIYIKNLLYVDKEYSNEKLKFLYDLKKELIEKELLKENKLFKEYIKSKSIIFYNINYDIKFLNFLSRDLNIKYLNDDNTNNYPKEIKHFKTIDEEIIYVGQHIIELLNNNILPSKIKIVGLKPEYIYPIKLIFSFLNINISCDFSYLYASNICKTFLDNLNKNVDDTIKLLEEKYPDSDILNQIIDICNKYYWCDNFLDIKELLIYEFKNAKIKKKRIQDEIEVIDYYDIHDSDNYYFLIGFNNENIPVDYKDTDYISDDLCDILHKEKSTERYLREKNLVIGKIKSTKNIIITYKDQTYFNNYLISTLNDSLNYEIVDGSNTITYSKELAHLKLSHMLERYEKYGELNSKLITLYNSIETTYKSYDNKFKGINKEELYKYLDNNLLLSYSSIDNYYKCGFKYYINNILKIDEFNSNFNTLIGSIMHYILSIYNKDAFNLDKECDQYLLDNNYALSNKEKFFIDKVKDNLKFIIDELQNQKKLTKFKNEIYEQKIYLEKNNKIKITLMGIIDKIMYLKDSDKTYVTIIDYKTGHIETDLKYVDNGLQLQLPIYAYLIKNSKIFKNPIISGLYYQKIINGDIKAMSPESYLEETKKLLKLQGISTSDVDILELFDSTYKDSDLVKGLKMTANGFSAYAKAFSQNELNDLLSKAELKIDEAINNIIDGKFDINPKQIKFENISCKYCKYRDICYMSEKDVVLIKEGDVDA